jgi:hypothetical protein
MTGHGILCAGEDDPPWPGRFHDDFIAWAESCFPQGADRNGGLVLGADSGSTSLSPNLYFWHLK